MDPALARACARFFARRLTGPAEARSAVLDALVRGEPYSFARRALSGAAAAGISRHSALRLGLIAEVARATLRTCAEACAADPLPTRMQRARRVLAADTLLTFSWELAAAVEAERASTVRDALARLLGARGLLASGLGRSPGDREAGGAMERIDSSVEAFLVEVLAPSRRW
ncbi:MAG: hypothetical protein H0V09_00740 [Gemmatimonadetes bacterium]|nr:hypothetical protein [Gemmatimonadota bacterium]